MEQLQPIRLRARHRLFVRINASFAELFQPNAGHESFAREAPALDLEFLMIHVQRPGRVLGEDALLLPIAQKLSGPRIAVVGRGVAGQFLVENQAHDVVGTAVVQSLLQRRIDDIIRRRDDVAELADPAKIVAMGAKGFDFSHDFLLNVIKNQVLDAGTVKTCWLLALPAKKLAIFG